MADPVNEDRVATIPSSTPPTVGVNSNDVAIDIEAGGERTNLTANSTQVADPQPAASAPNGIQQQAYEGSDGGRPCLHSGNCCMRTRSCLESSIFSFALGGLLFIGGIALIGVSSKLPSGDYFLIGPFMVAAGTILLIRGCINKIAKKQQLREEAERAERQARRGLTRDQRSQRNEEMALSQENIIIPPDYFEAVTPKPSLVIMNSPNMVNTGSQANFTYSPPRHMSTQASGPARTLTRLASVQSQTSFPTMVDMAVDTSDLPVDIDRASIAPPSYDIAVSRPVQTIDSVASVYTGASPPPLGVTSSPSATGAGVSYYLPDDD